MLSGKIGLNTSDRMAHTGAVSFDAITLEIFTTLLNGATLYPVDRDTLLIFTDSNNLSKHNRSQRSFNDWFI